MGMNCREFSGCVFYSLPTFEADLLPVEARDHLEVCLKCRAKIAELRAAFKLLRKKEKKLTLQGKKSLARVQDRLKRDDLDDLSEDPDVDCQKVRPFLPLAADSLGEIFPSGWMEEHLALCEDCHREFECLEELRRAMTVAEMPPWISKELFADASPEFLKKVQDLRAIPSEKITCKQAERYYRDAATYNLHVPPEIYRHVNNCTPCKDRVQQLRPELGVAIPEIGFSSIEDLITGKLPS